MLLIWNCALEPNCYNGDTDMFATPSRKFFLAGRRLKYNGEEIITAIADIPYRKCSTYRKKEAALAFPKLTVFDNRGDVFRPYSIALKLTFSDEESKISRFMY